MTDKIKLCARIVCFYHLVFINFSFKVAQIGWFLINLLIKHWQLQSNERKPDDKWRQSQTNCRFNFLGKKFSIYTLIYVIYMQLNVCLAYQISIYGIWGQLYAFLRMVTWNVVSKYYHSLVQSSPQRFDGQFAQMDGNSIFSVPFHALVTIFPSL